jgi:molybdopterin adenylyltransferase
MIKAAILTMSDKGYRGEREDLTGPAIKKVLEENGYEIEYYKVIPDEIDTIQKELIYICDELKLPLVMTNGGTGFAKRDVTPEATMKVIDKYVPGIGEAMRSMSMSITKRSMLSRGVAGIRKNSLIVNLPGSPKGAVENLGFVIDTLKHGIEILIGDATECAR